VVFRLNKWQWGAVAIAAMTTATVAACGGLAFTAANVPTLFGDYDRQSGVAYGEDERQQLDLYRPSDPAVRPIVVFFYGGSWMRGSRTNYRFVGAALAQSGFVTIVPDYRLYPQVKFPDFVNDGAAAVAWAVRNAQLIGGDPTQVFLAGHSAGAHTAAMLALDSRYLVRAGVDRAAVRGLIGISGPHVLTPDTPQLQDMFGAPYEPKDYRPIDFVNPKAPPTLLIHGAADSVVVARHSERLADALRVAGVPVELLLLAGKNHADPVAALSQPARGRAPTLAAIKHFIDAQGLNRDAPVAAE
jgi:acetyl esterase/lipase